MKEKVWYDDLSGRLPEDEIRRIFLHRRTIRILIGAGLAAGFIAFLLVL